MADLINSETLTAGGIGLALGTLILKGLPAALRWFIGNVDKDRHDKFTLMQEWREQLQADVKEARTEAKIAMQKVSDCEARHDETLKAMMEDKMKQEMSMEALKIRIDKISPS